MGLRLTMLVLAVLEILFPRRLVDFWMGVATEGDQEVTLRTWVYTVARVEGIVILLWLLTRGRRGGTEDDDGAADA